MTKSASADPTFARATRPPAALVQLLPKLGGSANAASLLVALREDRETTEGFLRLARAMLPGRRVLSTAEAVPLLGEVVGLRLVLTAAAAEWLERLSGGHALARSLIRHSFAAATAAEALAREAGSLSPLAGFALGLLHHVGDAARMGGQVTVGAATGEPLRQAGAPSWMIGAIASYRAASDDGAEPGLEAEVLAAADFGATSLGYGAPATCRAPWPDAASLPLLRRLRESERRVVASIEDLLGVVVDPPKPAPGSAIPGLGALSPVVMAEILEGVSTRDLGPLPVLFTRIAGASDYDSLAAALTAGVVEELGVQRAWFLELDSGATLTNGVVSSRGNVTLPVPELKQPVDQLPRALGNALTTAKPILHPSRQAFGFEPLVGNPDSHTLFVPVALGKDTLGVLGVEVDSTSEVVPDVMAAVAAHAALALKAVRLKQLSDDAMKDELTGLFNRRGILERLDAALSAAAERCHEIAIALIDCDHLKKVNDNFGHLMGDEFVRRISEVVRMSLRATDHLGRYGGDEFLAVMPQSSLEETEHAMERARARVEQAGYESEDGLLLSISVGAVVGRGGDVSRASLLQLADNALYRSKERGRNAVTVVAAEPT